MNRQDAFDVQKMREATISAGETSATPSEFSEQKGGTASPDTVLTF